MWVCDGWLVVRVSKGFLVRVGEGWRELVSVGKGPRDGVE